MKLSRILNGETRSMILAKKINIKVKLKYL
jgi:hypothetical protein